MLLRLMGPLFLTIAGFWLVLNALVRSTLEKQYGVYQKWQSQTFNTNESDLKTRTLQIDTLVREQRVNQRNRTIAYLLLVVGIAISFVTYF